MYNVYHLPTLNTHYHTLLYTMFTKSLINRCMSFKQKLLFWLKQLEKRFLCVTCFHMRNFGWKTRRTVPSNEPRRSQCHDVSAQEPPDPKAITSCHSKSYQVNSLGFEDCKQINDQNKSQKPTKKNPLLHNCPTSHGENICFFKIYVHLVPFDVVLPICQNTSKQYTRTHVISCDTPG